MTPAAVRETHEAIKIFETVITEEVDYFKKKEAIFQILSQRLAVKEQEVRFLFCEKLRGGYLLLTFPNIATQLGISCKLEGSFESICSALNKN